MKIDISTIFLVILLVLPGLFSRRSQNSVSPRSFEPQGSTEELAEFVAQGVGVHLTLGFLIVLALTVAGAIFEHQPLAYLWAIDDPSFAIWVQRHAMESGVLASLYVLLSFFIGSCFGLLCGVWRLNRPFTSLVVDQAKWLQRLGVTHSLGERPMTYQVFDPRPDAWGDPCVVFIEAEMKGDLGFYSGQLKHYALVKDAEAHKPIVIESAWYKKRREDAYESVEASIVMLDLGDVVTLQVDQISQRDLGDEDAVAVPTNLAEDAGEVE